MLALGVSACGGSSSGDGGDSSDPPKSANPDRLIGEKFISTAIVDTGEDPFPGHTRVKVSFDRHERQDWIGWSAACNGAGAKVRVTSTRLLIGGETSTLIGCQLIPQRQDAWLAEFFRSDPEWSLGGGELTLIAEDREIHLEREGT